MVKKNPVIEEALRQEMADVAAAAGCELIHVELKGGVLRLVLDRPGDGVTLDDCSNVSRQISALLDVVDFDPGRYTLEVSSPGLDRPLYRPEDYGRFEGRLARVTYRQEDGKKRTVVGRLAGWDPGDGGRVTLEEQDGGERLVLALDDVLAARLEVELP